MNVRASQIFNQLRAFYRAFLLFWFAFKVFIKSVFDCDQEYFSFARKFSLEFQLGIYNVPYDLDPSCQCSV